MTISLYGFQRDGVRRIKELDYRVLLADEVGLGKTLQALRAFKDCGARPGIVVCPASIKLNWQREAARFKIHTVVLEGRMPRINWSPVYNHPPLFITNYEILETWLQLLKSLKPKFIIIDEAQRICNPSAKCTQLVTLLCEDVPHIMELTGTPIVNRHWDLFSLLHILDPEKWDSPFSFGMQFCQAGSDHGRLQFQGSCNRKLLNKVLQSYMIRRLKEDVLPDLPPLRKIFVPIDIQNRREYEHAERDFIGWLSTYDLAAADRAARAARFVKFTYLKRLAAKGKMKFVFEWIDNWLVSSEGKLILGAWHRQKWPSVIQLIEDRYKDISVSIHGGIKDKDSIVQRFREDESVRIINLQLQSGGVGLNLQGDNRTMALLELPWNPAAVGQFIGRGHRIGTLNQVDCYFLLGANTIDERICQLIQEKGEICASTIDGGRVKNDFNLLDRLTESYQEKKRRKPCKLS